MATYYVSPTGSNTSPYDTWAKAATTINTALTAAKGNGSTPHTIYVGPGTYTDYPNCDDAELVGMQLLGVAAVGSTTIAGEDVVIINVQAGNHGIYLARANQVVKGFTFRSTAEWNRYHIYLLGGDGITIQRCYSQNAGGGHLLISGSTNFNISYNAFRGTKGKYPALKTSGAASGVITYNLFGPSQQYSPGYLYMSHTSGTVNIYNNAISNSYAYALWQDKAGATTNFSNNIVWANSAPSYTQPQGMGNRTILISAGTFNATNNLITGSQASTISPTSGMTTDVDNIYSQLPKLEGRNFSAGFICMCIDDHSLDAFEALAAIVHAHGGHVTMFVDGYILDEADYEARINALLADGHAIGSHTWSHTYLNATVTNAFTIRYTGSDTAPHITITAGDTSGSIALWTAEGNDNVTYNFDAASTVAAWIASSAKITLGAGGQWAVYNIATLAASPDYTSTLMHCTSLASIDADLAGLPLSATVTLAKTDETSGFLKDELVDWKAQLEALFGTVSTMATPGAQDLADATYTAIESAGFLGNRGSLSYAFTGAAFVDLRQFKIARLASLNGADILLNGMSEAAVRAKARDVAAYLWDNAASLNFYWHSITNMADEFGWFCEELQTAGIPMVTFPYLISYLRDAGNGWTVVDGVYTNLNLPLATSRHLLSGSPCINAGTDLGDSYDLDYDGLDQDAYGAGWEIGAYVFEGSSSSSSSSSESSSSSSSSSQSSSSSSFSLSSSSSSSSSLSSSSQSSSSESSSSSLSSSSSSSSSWGQAPNMADQALMAAADGVLESQSRIEMVYLPAAGGSRTIDMIVEYPGASSLDGLRGGSRPHMEVLVRNHATAGISSREIDTGGDKLQVPLRKGRSVRTVRIVEILDQDRAMLRLLAY